MRWTVGSNSISIAVGSTIMHRLVLPTVGLLRSSVFSLQSSGLRALGLGAVHGSSPEWSSHRTAVCAALLIGRDDATVKDAVDRLRGRSRRLSCCPWRRWVCCRRSTPRSNTSRVGAAGAVGVAGGRGQDQVKASQPVTRLWPSGRNARVRRPCTRRTAVAPPRPIRPQRPGGDRPQDHRRPLTQRFHWRGVGSGW
jgi:hypothetical protein